ncbi:histone acetyltransferase type B catalytic subunit-like [Hydractinia symbiolongicarpus]|uniref:histone acetyltransferase type B catalytic subunit-like n=1 Tax=Hydractinia symbiolongicarpus TaxID=13093 RepID=UPI002551464C|nr:histone acetyltransferase type B catalytic subunit-like [Hydractinia symbiolongicarpus]
MAVGSVDALNQGAEKYKCDSNDATFLKLVRNEEDVLNEDNAFHPWMSHQIFGDSETIFGYKNLKVNLYYHGGSLLTYLSMSCDEKIPSSMKINPDPVLPNVAEVLPEGFYSNRDEFIAKLPEENTFVPMGNKIHSYTRNDVEYEIYQADITVPRLKDYHARLQTFILWFIDGASFIDSDDERWNYFLLFEKKKGPVMSEYSIVGYITVYQYFAYPDKYRPRISQMLTLPPYQKSGHGVELLDAVNRYYITQANAIDITVEEPSEYFVRCRDFVDCRNCLKLNEFAKEKLLTGFTNEMKSAALKSFKITKKQSRRVYEILRLKCTDQSNVDMYRDYRLDVKNRLNIPFQKQARDMQKLKHALSPEEYNAAMVGQTHDERIQRLDEAYNMLQEEYTKVITRLDAS